MRWWVVSSCLWLAACAPSDPCAGLAAAGDPSLAIGIGDPDRFAGPTADGETVTPAWGSQGGRHLWLSLRTTAFWPGTPRVLGGDAGVPVFGATLVDRDTGDEVTTQDWGWSAMDGDEIEATIALGELFLPWSSGSTSTTGAGTDDGLQDVALDVVGEDVCGTRVEAALDLTIAW